MGIIVDGLGNGFGYAIILVIVAFIRELLGSGSLLGFEVIPQSFYDFSYMNCGLMVIPNGSYNFRMYNLGSKS